MRYTVMNGLTVVWYEYLFFIPWHQHETVLFFGDTSCKRHNDDEDDVSGDNCFVFIGH